MDQTGVQVNPVTLHEARMSFIHFMPALAAYRSVTPPTTPCKFLFSEKNLLAEYALALKQQGGASRAPWFAAPGEDGYGKLFWRNYFSDKSPAGMRRALVPIDYDLGAVVSSLTLPDSKVAARAYLYPWGIGVLLDLTLQGPWPLNKAVDLMLDIRNRSRISWKMGSDSGMATPEELAGEIRKRLEGVLYGNGVQHEDGGEQLSIVTVTDGENVAATDAIVEGDPIHRALEGLTGWNRLWESIVPKAGSLKDCQIASRSAPAGHSLYGKDRTRAVWFPGDFRSVADYPFTLSCYHQNLSAATLQTEAMCVLVQDAAAVLRRAGSLAQAFSGYRDSAKIAAGVLGRLHGRKSDDAKGTKPPTYRSGSLRAQILNYKDDVNLLRTSLLNPPTPLDA